MKENRRLQQITALFLCCVLLFCGTNFSAFADEVPLPDPVAVEVKTESSGGIIHDNSLSLPEFRYFGGPHRLGYSGAIPSSYNACEEGFVTSVKDQSSCGNCWAFSAISCLESDAIKKYPDTYTVDNTDFSEAHLTLFSNGGSDGSGDRMFDPGFNVLVSSSKVYVDNGVSSTQVGSLAIVPSQNKMTYTTVEGLKYNVGTASSSVSISGYGINPDGTVFFLLCVDGGNLTFNTDVTCSSSISFSVSNNKHYLNAPDPIQVGTFTANGSGYTYTSKTGHSCACDTNSAPALLIYNDSYIYSRIGGSLIPTGYNIRDPFAAGGNWQYAVAALSNWSGIATETDFPFTDKQRYIMRGYTDRFNHGSGVVLENCETLTDSNSVKRWILDHGSASTAVYWDTSYLNNGDYCCTVSGHATNHAITIVGWDDFHGQNGAWIVKNSWGANSYDNGYFYLSYADQSTGGFIGYSVRSDENLLSNYSYNAVPSTRYYVFSPTMSYANVYTAEKYEDICSVGFYTMEEGDSLRIRVYNGRKTSNPVSGSPVADTTVYVDNAGYHTVDLPEPYSVSPGDVFTVVISLLNTETYVCGSCNKVTRSTATVSSCPYCGGTVSHTLGVSFEGSTNYLGEFKSGSYESFYTGYSNLYSWNDMSSQGNFYIQVHTVCRHTYTEAVTPAICTQAGTSSLTCSQCGKTVSETIPPTGHAPGEAAVENYTEATCETEGGYDTVVRCLTCELPISSEHTTFNPTGHSWGPYGSHTSEGQYRTISRTCETCGKTESETTYFVRASTSDLKYNTEVALKGFVYTVFYKILKMFIPSLFKDEKWVSASPYRSV